MRHESGLGHRGRSRDGVRGTRLLNGTFDLNLNGRALLPNTSTIQWNGGEAYFGGGSSNADAQIEQVVRLRPNQVRAVRFFVNTAGSGGTSSIRCDVLNHLGVIIATVNGPTGVFSTTPDFSGPGCTIRFTDTSTGILSSQDTRLDNVSLLVRQPSLRFRGGV